MEENVLFQKETDAKIDSVIKEAMKKDELMECKDYIKLRRIIEKFDAKIIGNQAKFEMRFNLDLVFGDEKANTS